MTSRVSQSLFQIHILDSDLSITACALKLRIKKFNNARSEKLNTNAAFIGWQFAAFELCSQHSCYEIMPHRGK
jgi:hypothetical protein